MEKNHLKIILKENCDRSRIEESKREKYNPDNIFKNRNQVQKTEENAFSSQIAMVEYKESIFKKIIHKIKFLFRTPQ